MQKRLGKNQFSAETRGKCPEIKPWKIKKRIFEQFRPKTMAASLAIHKEINKSPAELNP